MKVNENEKYSEYNYEKGKKSCFKYMIILLTIILIFNSLILIFCLVLISLFNKQNKELKENNKLYNFNNLSNGIPTLQYKTPAIIDDRYTEYLFENFDCNEENKHCMLCDNSTYHKCLVCQPNYKLVRGRCMINYSIKAVYHSDYANENVSLIYRLPSEIIEMTIDNIKVKPSTSYTFRKIGYHTVYFLFDLSNTKSLSHMFYSIGKLSGISFTPLFNSENITDINSMFFNCRSLQYIDLHNFNTVNVENMNLTFRLMDSLVSIDLSLLNTQNVRYMHALLSNNPSLKYVNFSNLNTEKVEDMGHMFAHDISLTSLYMYNFNTKNVKDMWAMFYNLSSLHYLDISNFNTEKVTNSTWMFAHCINLSFLDISSLRFNVNSLNLIAGWKSPGTIRIHSSVLNKVRNQIPSNWHIISL